MIIYYDVDMCDECEHGHKQLMVRSFSLANLDGWLLMHAIKAF
jgi:hypothetical protein